MFRALILLVAIALSTSSPLDANPLVYEGGAGPGNGKHIVFLAGDHEYRSEESLPAMARILAKHHGFKCTVLFTVDKETGEINPGCSNMPGTEALDDADLMVIFLRFQNFPKEQMDPIVNYLNRGGPVVGMRTATHAFNIPKDSEFHKYHWQYGGDEYKKGFGRQVLGETWVSHYGANHRMSTRLDIVPSGEGHPILTGIENVDGQGDMWVECGGYWVDPMADSTVLANAIPLQSMKPDAPIVEGKEWCPGSWVRTYKHDGDGSGRVFNTTYGASEDLRNEPFRRMMINACFWGAGLEDKIQPDLNVDFVGPYNPVTYGFNTHRLNVKPEELASYDVAIMPEDKPIAPGRQKKK